MLKLNSYGGKESLIPSSNIDLDNLSDEGLAKLGGLPMFAHIWSDHIFNDVSYLRADNFSWHNGTIYVTAYEILEKQYNNEKSIDETENGISYKRTPDGFKIANVSQEDAIRALYETEGIAWFYILDTENKRFKLPRTKWGFVGVRDGVGNPVEAELPNITSSDNLFYGTRTSNTNLDNDAFYYTIRNSDKGYTPQNQTGASLSTVSFDASRSNSTYKDGATVQSPATQMYLYFYVGKSKRPETEVNLGQITEGLNNKIDRQELMEVQTVVETYSNEYSWYRIYSDGWCEQGGRFIIPTSGGATLTFLKEFKDTYYNLTITKSSQDSSSWNIMTYEGQFTTATAPIKANLTGYSLGVRWTASGYLY